MLFICECVPLALILLAQLFALLGSAQTKTAALAAGRRLLSGRVLLDGPLLGGRVLLDGPFAGRDVPHALALGERASSLLPFLASYDAEVGEPSPTRAFGMKAACSR